MKKIFTFWLGRHGNINMDVMTEEDFLDNYNINVSYVEWIASGGELSPYAKTFDDRNEALGFLSNLMLSEHISKRQYTTFSERIWRS